MHATAQRKYGEYAPYVAVCMLNEGFVCSGATNSTASTTLAIYLTIVYNVSDEQFRYAQTELRMCPANQSYSGVYCTACAKMHCSRQQLASPSPVLHCFRRLQKGRAARGDCLGSTECGCRVSTANDGSVVCACRTDASSEDPMRCAIKI